MNVGFALSFFSIAVRRRALHVTLFWLFFFSPLWFDRFLEDAFLLPQLFGLCAGTFFCICVSPRPFFFAVCGWRKKLLLFAAAGCLSGILFRPSWFWPAQTFLFLLGPLWVFWRFESFFSYRKAAVAAVSGACASVVYGVLQSMGWDDQGWVHDFSGRSFSTLGNPVYLAGHLTVLFPLALWLAFSSRGKRRWFGWTACAVFGVGFWMTQTRAVLAALTASAGVAWFFQKRNDRKLLIFSAVIAAWLLAWMLPAWKERLVGLFHGTEIGARGRMVLAKTALELFREHPVLGSGPGSFAASFHRLQSPHLASDVRLEFWTAHHAHNEYLELAAQRGLVGVGLGFWMLAAWLGALRARGAPQAGVAPFLLCGAAGAAAYSFFHFPFSIPPTVFALAMLYRPADFSLQSSVRFSRVVFLFLTVLLFGYGILLRESAALHQAVDFRLSGNPKRGLLLLEGETFGRFFDRHAPRRLLEKAKAAEQTGDFAAAKRFLQRVLERDPWNAPVWADLGRVLGKSGDLRGALSACRRALHVSPYQEEAWNNLAVAAAQSRDFPQAVSALQRLAEIERARGKVQAAEGHETLAERLKERSGKPY